jgi:chromate transporter
VVIGLFAIALYRLGKTAASTVPEVIIGIAAAGALVTSRLGIVAILVLAGCTGLFVFHRGPSAARTRAVAALLLVATLSIALWMSASPSVATDAGWTPNPKSLVHLGLFFLKVGAFTIGGGLTMIAFIQDQVVDQFGWLTPREFVDGLALGQLTPGPVLMIAAYVGYKLAGIGGAIVAASAAFLPSFVIMLAILPVLDRVRQMAWVKATMKGMAPAVIGVLAVSLIRLSPAAVPDPFALLILIGTIAATLALRVGAYKAMIGGAVLGVLRSQLPVSLLTRHF